MARTKTVGKGKILGFQIRQQGNSVVAGVDFKAVSNVPIKHVSRNIQEIQNIVDTYNENRI